MPTITQLQYILSVAKNKHFGRAAKECHVSQPSLSAQIQKVEDELDTIIFDRSKKPVMTTDSGQRIIDQAKSVLREHKKIFDLGEDESTLSGSFHLAVIPTLAAYVIPLFIERFSEKFPEVQLTITEAKTEDIIAGLQDDLFDGGLLVTPLYDDKLIERILFYEPFYVFASENHRLRKKKTVKESDIDISSIWLLEEGHCFRDQVIKVCSLNKQGRVLPNINFASGNLETLINLIRKGRGHTLLPYLATEQLHDDEKEKNLKKFQKPVPTREVSLVASRSFLKQGIIEALESEIIEGLPGEIKSLKRKASKIIDI